ncbi:AAA domain-containing protein [Hyalangium gracile]|uniref:AAA domain-containing protein n=1 Tax=Hyalangium gracile TaxID=394092 RepID=UPI001CCDDF8E|nr:AAA domain-containing protein [Hyalangium gracile]
MPRQDILEFFRFPRRFSGSRTSESAELWTAALEQIALPRVSSGSSGGFREAQVRAWRGIAEHRAALVLGPPGTGKTFVLAWMALAYLEARRNRGLPCRILLTGFTRNSIANLLETIHRQALNHKGGELSLCWLGNEPDQELPEGIEVVPAKEGASVLERPYLIMGSTSWSLYRLVSQSKLPSSDGETVALFDLVCIDEASQMVVSQGLMCLAGLKEDGRVLVAGDNRQLPPVHTVHEHAVDERRIGGSLYDFLADAGVQEFPLEETFRLNAPLADFPAKRFYEGRYHAVFGERRLELREGWDAGLADWEREALEPARPVCILLHEGPSAGTQNPFEVAVVTRLATLFRERMLPLDQGKALSAEDFWNERLAIITPHRAQNVALRESLRARGLGEGCVVETVDRIQGRERDAILASYTVADAEFAKTEAEFIFSSERFNVTITRARTKLVLVISRRLLETLPEDADVFDAAQDLRDFVFSSEDRGQVWVPGSDGTSWLVSIRVRRFDATEPLPRLEPPPSPRPVPAPLPSTSPALEELLNAIQAVALRSEYGTAPNFELKKVLGHEPSLEQLRALCRLGRISLLQLTGRFGQFWAARPLNPARLPFPVDPDTVRERIDEVIIGARSGRLPPFYTAVRERFEWVGPEGQDVLEPVVNDLAREGVVRWGETGHGRTLEYVDSQPAAPEAMPPAEPLEDLDYELLNQLESRETRRINFGVFEQWTTPRELMQVMGWDAARISASLLRLAENGWVLISESGRIRSRAAELARQVRYVKQRFQKGDASKRPFLVRAMKLEVKDREKPERNRLLSKIETGLFERLRGIPEAERALAGMGMMLRKRWKTEDPGLSGFQERALAAILPAWLGLSKDDSFVITAETGTGKTEAGVLPLMVGAAVDQMRGVSGTRAVLVYPRIRLAANQAQRLAGYLAALAEVEGMPTLTLGMQNQDVPRSFRPGAPGKNEDWARGPDGSVAFPFFQCPEHACGGAVRLQPGHGHAGADLLSCKRCGWRYAGWIGSQERLREHPPHFFLPVTESLHQWMHRPEAGRLFGDLPPFSAPRAVLADEIHLYSHLHGAQVGYALRRLLTRTEFNRCEHGQGTSRTLALGMSATLGNPDEVWGRLCGRQDVKIIQPEEGERKPNPRGREYFYFVQPEIESRGRDIAGASTTIQSLMCLAHGMRRRSGDEGGFRGIAFFDSIDKLKRLHSDYRDAEEGGRLAQLRTRLYDDDLQSGQPRRECCRSPDACDHFRQGECWYFAATDRRQRRVGGAYSPGQPLAVCERPIFSGTGGKADELVQRSDLIFSTSSLEVGFDDPEMILVYQHYAPLNLASFVQRKGRGGRSSDDRPLTGVTLSAYSARDSWFFRRPREMLDAKGFEVPLNMENYFVCRGQVIALLLDLVARRRCLGKMSPPGEPNLLAEADPLVRATFGEDVYSRLEVSSLGELWTEATRGISLDTSQSPYDWANKIHWVPRPLFQSSNLPRIEVTFPNDMGELTPRTEDMALAFSECVPGNMTRRFGFTTVHWLPPANGREPLQMDKTGFESWPRFSAVPGGVKELQQELPLVARALLGPRMEPQVVRPPKLILEKGGRFLGTEWQPDWAYDPARRKLQPYKAGGELPSVNHKSQGRLQGFIVVDARPEMARFINISTLGRLASRLEVFQGSTARGSQTGLKLSRVFWGADARLVLEQKRKREDAYVSQVFVHPEDQGLPLVQARRPLLHGYQVETEGVRLHLDRVVLETFIQWELERLQGAPAEKKWLHGQHLRFLLMSHGAAAGLNSYQLRQVADLMVTAAAFKGVKEKISGLVHRWSAAQFGELLDGVYRRHLRQHPMLSDRRMERLREELISASAFADVLRRAMKEVASSESFTSYLRSVVVHGLAIRLGQAFVRHGRGDERRILFHVKLPVQFAQGAEDIITIAEDGSHGDGTTRTFLRHLGESLEELHPSHLGACPNVEEDRLVNHVFEREADAARWRSWDPRDERRIQALASELGVDLESNAGPIQGVLRLLYGTEELGTQRYELYQLHREIRSVRVGLEKDLEREASAWELVGAVVARAAENHASVPQWSQLLENYRALDDALQEESLSAEARLADQAYRLSARLCVDGCQTCLHTGSTIMDDDLAEVVVSRRMLEQLGAFLEKA